jgi:hypothetical protein
MKKIDIDLVRSLLDYDPLTGIFRWKSRRNWSAPAGSVAGSRDTHGYTHICINRQLFLAHRLAWAVSHGEQPGAEIDHINGDRSDNRIANLRCVSGVDNQRNRKLMSTNTSGYCGVYWDKNCQKWSAKIRIFGKLHNIGHFSSIEDAIAARKEAEIRFLFDPLHGKTSEERIARPLD